MIDGIVREWHEDEGWGVLDAAETPGGCWTHYSALELPGLETVSPGDLVAFEFESGPQDGFAFRATRVFPVGLGLDPVPVRVFRPGDLVAADPTPGMARERAFELPGLWAGQVTTSPGAVSGWHHHERNDSSLYVVAGLLRLEFEGEAEPLDAYPGDFVHVPAYTIHRESNPGDVPSVAVIARAGGGIPTVNVDQAPAPHG